jgi:integrase
MSIKKINGIYRVRFMFKGQEINRSAGKGSSKKDAIDLEQRLRKECRDIENGLVPDKTIDEGIARWLEEYILCEGGLVGADKYRSHVRGALPYFEGRPLTQIHLVAQEMIADMKKQNYAPSTMRCRLNPLRRVANLAYKKWDWLAIPLSHKFPSIKPSAARELFLSIEELDQLATACDREDARDVMYFLAYTGLRCAEMWRLNEHSLRDDNTLVVDSKGGFKRAIPLNAPQVEFVKKYVPLQMKYLYVRYHFDKAKKAIGKDDLCIHDLRHTYGTMLADAGTPLRTIMAFMGHKTVTQSEAYTLLSIDHLREYQPVQKLVNPAPKLHVVGAKSA